MSVKKLALLGVASLVSFGAIAGAPAAQMSGIYVGVDVGASHNETLDLSSEQAGHILNHGVHKATVTSVSTKNTPLSWAFSALMGYQFNSTWSLQFGYLWDQEQKLNVVGSFSRFHQHSGTTTTWNNDGDISLKAYNLYLAMKIAVPLSDQFNAYVLAGPAYSHLKWTFTDAGKKAVADESEKDSYYSPMAAVGVSYAMCDSVSFNAQYMFIAADMHPNHDSLQGFHTSTQRFTVGANYLFAM